MTPVFRQVHVRVPATSANLGSGFDTVGLALDYYDELDFTLHGGPGYSGWNYSGSGHGGSAEAAEDTASGVAGIDTSARVIIHGEGEGTLPRDETHLVVSTFRRACQVFGLGRLGFTLEAHNRIPQARGMGSSAEAIVAGISAAAALAHGVNFDRQSVFDMAASIEGHPDNVAPAVFGGLTFSWRFDAGEGIGSVPIRDGEPLPVGFHTTMYPVDDAIRASVFVPDFEQSTEQARQALPAQVPYKDAVFNLSRVGLLPAAMGPQNGGWRGGEPYGTGTCDSANALLLAATQDRLHQPYRRDLMASSWELIEALRAQGFAAAISGAGPCVLVLHSGSAAQAIDQVARPQLESGSWRVLHLGINTTGVEVEAK
ncbi:homoserine kinase [Bifidobacterium sp.]|jgi:homoserine kinase|uniref:homoserine kinase n=1 Tax=Bifidobacterium sp. TaxID=41200 RepID=UPI0025C14DB6|nr:homoserine kinase [Bifidobacterium sp.]MCH4209787.1 homoserine kinase [Bifidobacterium sp.]MCI1224578.1 homoserine kinase [Bifidobacterium sp.]